MNRRRRIGSPWSLAVWVLVLAYVAFFGTLSVRRHHAFQSTAFDLGNVDQAVWNTRQGRPFAMTNIEGLTSRLGTHVEPILPCLALVYFAWSDPRALLLLQTAVIALGAWPVYLLVRWAGRSSGMGNSGPGSRDLGWQGEALALTFAAVYLLFPALQSANLCDFHALALAPTFFLAALYCLETERWGGLALFSVLTMACKEDMPLLVAMLGLYAIVTRRGRNWRVGLPMIVVAAAWFALAVGYILPRFDTGDVSPLGNRYTHLGATPLDIALSPVTRPAALAAHLFTAGNLAYLRDLLTPVAFLSLLAPHLLLLAAPGLAVNLLSSEAFMHELEGGYYYGAPLVPLVVVSAAYGAAWLIRRLPRFRLLPVLLAALVLASSLFYHRGHGFTPLSTGYRRVRYAVGDHQRLGQAMACRIPAGASLAALARLTPHASQRQELYTVDRIEDGLPAFIHKTDYLWLDVTNAWPLHPADLKATVDKLLTMGYGVEEAADGWLLLRLGAADTTLPDAFYDFARASGPDPRVPLHLQFLLDGEPALECLGLDWTWHPRGVQLTTYWRALQPLPPGLQPVALYVEDAANPDSEGTLPQPLVAPIWYPPHRWPVGELVAASTEVWPVDVDLRVGLAVVRGGDWGDANRRLPIEASSPPPVGVFDGDRWACVLQIRGGGIVPAEHTTD
jgi:uncharacterized membrane protein